MDTAVEAYVGDVLCGEGTVQDLGDPIGVGYLVDVFADAFKPGCGTDEATVMFRVGGVPAAETGAFQTGSFVQLDLTADGEPAPPPAPVTVVEPGTEPPPEEVPAAPEPAPEPESEPGAEPERDARSWRSLAAEAIQYEEHGGARHVAVLREDPT